MEPGYVYLCGFCDLLFLLSLLLVASLITSWLLITIKARRMPNAYEQRLMQIQMIKEQAQAEMDRLTQEYLQRMKNKPRSNGPRRGGKETYVAE